MLLDLHPGTVSLMFTLALDSDLCCSASPLAFGLAAGMDFAVDAAIGFSSGLVDDAGEEAVLAFALTGLLGAAFVSMPV